MANPRRYGAADGSATPVGRTPVRAMVGAGLRGPAGGSGAVAAHLAELRARLAAPDPIMVRPYAYCLRGRRPCTLRYWGDQCETTGFWDPGRHSADRLQCLLELFTLQL
jgi:hypothetical protein